MTLAHPGAHFQLLDASNFESQGAIPFKVSVVITTPTSVIIQVSGWAENHRPKRTRKIVPTLKVISTRGKTNESIQPEIKTKTSFRKI
jgi:hypothetical protein